MEQKLANFRSAFEASPNAVLLMGADGRILLTNPRLDQLFGYMSGELIGKLVEVLVPDEVRAHHPELRDAFFRLPSARDMGIGRELFGVAKDGRRIPLEIGLNPVETEHGTLVLAAILDITARKAQDEKMRLAIDAASTAMVMVERSGRIVLTNQQACETFGYADGELIGKPVEELVPVRFRRRHAVYRTSFAQSPRRRSMGEGTDLYGLRKDGSEFPLEIGLTPIQGHDGTFIMSTIHDITDRKRYESQMAERNEELARLNEELSQFAYSASHDLKAPLSTISGLLRCAYEDLHENQLADLGSNIGRALDLAAQLAHRIEDMLALARSDVLEVSKQPTSLRDTLEEIGKQLSGILERNGVQLECSFGHEDPVLVEPFRIFQLLENLVENAVKYSDTNKAERRVRVETENAPHGLRIRVIDNGIGIPANRHGEVFKMFKRFGNHRHPGSGLGLALVHKHVQRMGGEIRFESTADGTRFEIDVPLDPAIDTAGEAR